jgi:hypothetical protein
MSSTNPWDRLTAGSNTNDQYLLRLGNAQIDANKYNSISALDRRASRSQLEQEYQRAMVRVMTNPASRNQ